MRRRRLEAIVLAGAALAAAPVLHLLAEARPAEREVVMKDLRFGPAPVGLKVGDAVVWANDDIFAHTATAEDKSFDLVLKPKARARMVLRKAGRIPFLCTYHPGMRGVLEVAP
jgi:plastocyanin